MLNARQATVNTLVDLFKNKQSLQQSIPFYKEKIHTADQALYQALVYGVLREQQSLTALRNELLKTPINDHQSVIGIILNLGIYQLLRMSLGDHGVINETVNLCHYYKANAMKGLVNAILRRVQRDRDRFKEELDNKKHLNLPKWISSVYKKEALSLAQIFYMHPPMTLRIRLPNTPDHWLSNHRIEGTVNPLHPQSVTLSTPCSVENIPGFSEGQISVQDASAQWPATLLNLKDKHHILDACAAPGGKTGHMLELSPDSSLVAIDKDAKRLEKVRDNLSRLNLKADCIATDAADIEQWWDKRKFDRILLDAPCSGSGVIHRHPDIPYLRTAKDLSEFSKVQFTLLKKLWKTLADDGFLLYTTCSILPRENQYLIEQFINMEKTAHLQNIDIPFSENTGFGSLHLPDNYGDGFFYALLKKSDA